MKLRILKYKTDQILKNSKALRANLSYKKSLTIGIIFTVEDKQKHFAVKEFVKHLEHDGKHVQVLEFLPEKKENYEFKFEFFTSKDFSFWGNLHSASAIQFADAPLDFLLYLDLTPNPMILNLLARSKAKCRVGPFWPEGSNYLDFMIESTSNSQALIDAIYKYVMQLR